MDIKWAQYYLTDVSDLNADNQTTIYQSLKKSAAENADKIAIEYLHTKITYSSLIKQIDTFASILKKDGFGPGKVLTVMLRSGPASIIVPYATVKCGGMCSLAHSDIKSGRFVDIVTSVDAEYIVMSEKQYEYLKRLVPKTRIKKVYLCSETDYLRGIDILRVKVDSYIYDEGLFSSDENAPDVELSLWRDIMKKSVDEIEADNDASKTAFLFHTGKSDDASTIIEVSSGAINAYAGVCKPFRDRFRKKLRRYARVYAPIESCYIFSVSFGCHLWLMNGDTLCLPAVFQKIYPKGQLKFYKPDIFIGFASVVAHVAQDRMYFNANFKYLKAIISVGDNFSPETKSKIVEFFGQQKADAEFYEFSGQEETNYFLFLPQRIEENTRASGIPVPKTLVKIIDKNTYYEMNDGQEGFIAVYSPFMMNGYYKNPEKTSGVLRKMYDGRTWFVSDVIGKSQDGLFQIVGKRGRRFDVGGTFVYPDVCEGLINNVYGVKECSVVVATDRDNIPFIAAEIVPDDDIILDVNKLRELKIKIETECQMMMPQAMCPSVYEFRAYLPRTSNNTIDTDAVYEKVQREQYSIEDEI